MAGEVRVVPAPVAVSGVAEHFRITAGASATLADLLTAAGAAVPTLPNGRKPDVLYVSVESGQPAVRYTKDGSSPTAIHGLLLPTEPSRECLPYPEQIARTGTVSTTNQQLRFYAAGSATMQLLFEFL